MFETKDLPSYYPGYDEYCEPKKEVKEYDYADEYHEEIMLRKEIKIVNREIIDLEIDNVLFDDSLDLNDYVWQGTKLIPAEMIGGK